MFAHGVLRQLLYHYCDIIFFCILREKALIVWEDVSKLRNLHHCILSDALTWHPWAWKFLFFSREYPKTMLQACTFRTLENMPSKPKPPPTFIEFSPGMLSDKGSFFKQGKLFALDEEDVWHFLSNTSLAFLLFEAVTVINISTYSESHGFLEFMLFMSGFFHCLWHL